MLYMPCVLIIHDAFLTFFQDFQQEGRDIGFGTEVGDRGEERLEVEDYGAGEGEAAQGLPVDAEVDAWKGEQRSPVWVVGV